MEGNFVLRIIRGSKDIYQKYLGLQSVQQYLEMSSSDLHGYLSFLSILIENIQDTTEEEKKHLETFDAVFATLCEKCRRYALSEKEEKIFRKIIAYSLVYDFGFMNWEILSIYLNHYSFGKDPQFTPDELILLQAYSVQFINQMTASSISLVFALDCFTDATCHIRREEGKFILQFDKSVYRELLEAESLSKDDYYYLLFYNTYGILHEYLHSRQMLMLVNGEDSLDLSRIRKEVVVLYLAHDFYEKYHNNFKIENDADDFAFHYLSFVLKGMVPEKEFESAFQKLRNDLNSAYQDNLPAEKFEQLLEEEYHKVSSGEEIVMNTLK